MSANVDSGGSHPSPSRVRVIAADVGSSCVHVLTNVFDHGSSNCRQEYRGTTPYGGPHGAAATAAGGGFAPPPGAVKAAIAQHLGTSVAFGDSYSVRMSTSLGAAAVASRTSTSSVSGGGGGGCALLVSKGCADVIRIGEGVSSALQLGELLPAPKQSQLHAHRSVSSGRFSANPACA